MEQSKLTKHELCISSLHDAQASCSCGGWYCCYTGAMTREELIQAFYKHLGVDQRCK